MRVFRLTVIVGILTLFVQCASVPLTGRKQVILLPESEMMQMSLTSYGDFLKENKMNFSQFLRSVNFIRDMSKEQLNDCIEAYKNGEFDNHGWY